MPKSTFNKRDEEHNYVTLTLKYAMFIYQTLHYIPDQWCMYITLSGTKPGCVTNYKYILYQLAPVNLNSDTLYRINNIDHGLIDSSYRDEDWDIIEILIYKITSIKLMIKRYSETETPAQEFIRAMCWITMFLVITIPPAVYLEIKKSKKKSKIIVSMRFTRDNLLISL